MEQMYTQNTSLWVGISNNSDPLIRRQEAFMDAFCQYILSNKVSVSGSIIEDWEKPRRKVKIPVVSTYYPMSRMMKARP